MYDLNGFEMTRVCIDDLQLEIGQEFSIEGSDEVSRFQKRADSLCSRLAELKRRRVLWIRSFWVLAAMLVVYALSPLGWPHAMAGAGAVMLACIAVAGENRTIGTYEAGIINAVQSKQDFFTLDRIELVEDRLAEKISAVEARRDAD